MHLNLFFTLLAVPVMACISLFFFARKALIPAIFAAIATCGLIGAAANGHGSCVSTASSASSACGSASSGN